MAGEIDSGDRLSAALELVEKAGPGGTVSAEELAKTCCFGLVYKEEEMRSAVLRTLASMSPDTAWESVGKILETTRKSLPFSDGAKVRPKRENPSWSSLVVVLVGSSLECFTFNFSFFLSGQSCC